MLKPLTMSATTSFVCSFDPAIDRDQTDLKKYGEASISDPGRWKDLLKFKTGQDPTVFIIGAIPPADMARLNDETKGNWETEELRWRAFLLAVRDIQNWSGDKPPKQKVDGVERIDREWLENSFVRGLRAAALEVGLVSYFWNMMSETEAKN